MIKYLLFALIAVAVLTILVFLRTPLQETEDYSFYLKPDDSSTLIIVDKARDESYVYKDYAKEGIDIATLEDMGVFLADKNMVFASTLSLMVYSCSL